MRFKTGDKVRVMIDGIYSAFGNTVLTVYNTAVNGTVTLLYTKPNLSRIVFTIYKEDKISDEECSKAGLPNTSVAYYMFSNALEPLTLCSMFRIDKGDLK